MDSDTSQEPNKFAQHFREMADRIEKNAISDFGGAFLFVPPDGEVIAFYIADPKRDTPAFLVAAAGKIAVAQNELQQKQPGGYPGRR